MLPHMIPFVVSEAVSTQHTPPLLPTLMVRRKGKGGGYVWEWVERLCVGVGGGGYMWKWVEVICGSGWRLCVGVGGGGRRRRKEIGKGSREVIKEHGGHMGTHKDT